MNIVMLAIATSATLMVGSAIPAHASASVRMPPDQSAATVTQSSLDTSRRQERSQPSINESTSYFLDTSLGRSLSMQGQDQIGTNQVLTADEGIQVQQRFAALKAAKQWHWMGNYGNVYDPVNVANRANIGPGGLIMNFNFSNGLIATWMFY